jgi:hypothetical protein
MQLAPRLKKRDGVTDLARLLDPLDAVSEGKEEISVEAMLKTVGQRSFGSLLLLPGLMAQ